MDNITNTSWILPTESLVDCDDLTNNGLYLIFVGYLVPLLSPRLRNYGRELISSIKNVGKITGNIVSLTEYGFEKVQGLSTNGEMVSFIERLCEINDLSVLPTQLIELSWEFSGDTDSGKKVHMLQTWSKLRSELERYNMLNKLNKTTKP